MRTVLLPFIFIASFIIVQADPGGKAGRLLTTSGGCGDCHGAASSNTKISITSKTGSFSVLPGSKTEFTATVAHATKTGAGITIGVKKQLNSNSPIGMLDIIAGQGLKKIKDTTLLELVQSAPKSIENGKADFSFTWTAPAQPGTYYLMATGNAVNRNGGESGDEWNFMTPIQLTVTNSTAISEQSYSFIEANIFPNPVHESSIVQYILPQTSCASYVITNMVGQRIFAQDLGIQAEGVHAFSVLGIYSLLNQGHYLLSLHTSSGIQTIPFIKQ